MLPSLLPRRGRAALNDRPAPADCDRLLGTVRVFIGMALFAGMLILNPAHLFDTGIRSALAQTAADEETPAVGVDAGVADVTEPRTLDGLTVQEMEDVPSEELLELIAATVRESFGVIDEHYPGALDADDYQLEEGADIEDFVEFISRLGEDLRIGGSVQVILHLKIAETQNLIDEIEDSIDLPESFKESSIARLTGQLGEFQETQAILSELREEIDDFVRNRAPMLIAMGEIEGTIAVNEQIIDALGGLRLAARLTLEQIDNASDDPEEEQEDPGTPD